MRSLRRIAFLGAAVLGLSGAYAVDPPSPPPPAPGSGQEPPPSGEPKRPPAPNAEPAQPPAPNAEPRTPPGEQPPASREDRRPSAQDDRGAPEQSAPRSNSFHRAKQILGSKVSIEGNLSIGSVEDLVFADDGRVEYIVVANEGKLVSVPWAAARFNFDQKTAVVGITKEKFQSVPTYTSQSWPAFDTTYRTTTYGYYNIPVRPSVERKMERRMERGRRP